MKKIIFIFVLISSFLFAQNQNKVLTQAYIDAYIENYIAIEEAISEMNVDLENGGPEELKSAFEASSGYNNVVAILQKYGLGKNAFDVYIAIGIGYIVATLDEYAKQAEGNDAKKEIKKIAKEYRKYIQKDDLKLIVKNKKKIDDIFFNEEVPQD